MKILLTGATGFVGTALVTRLLKAGHQVTLFSRDKNKALSHFHNHPAVSIYEWKDTMSVPPIAAFEGIQAVVNLMGENIGGHRWSEEQKKKLITSRVDATHQLVTALNETQTSPECFIQASAIGFYPSNLKKDLDENSPAGIGFLPDLCRNWEAEGMKAIAKRHVIIRTGVVLEAHGGALHKMLPPFKMGLGGPIGDGNQMMSWIHLDDLAALYEKAITDSAMNGIYNGVAPVPVNNFDFTKALGRALKRPTIIPVPATALKLAMGEMSSIVLDSQKVLPVRTLASGFSFSHSTIESAFAAIFKK